MRVGIVSCVDDGFENGLLDVGGKESMELFNAVHNRLEEEVVELGQFGVRRFSVTTGMRLCFSLL